MNGRDLSGWVVVLWVLLPVHAWAAEPRKLAFLVGIDRYEKHGLEDLKYADDDAEVFGAALRSSGFETVSLLRDRATGAAIRAQFAAFVRRTKELAKRDIVLVSLSGHGVEREIKRGQKSVPEPFFCPYDAQINDPETLVSINEIMQELIDYSGSSQNLLLIDACRNDPDKGSKGLDGSTVKELPAKLSVMFACSRGQRSFESEKVSHGVFTYVLLEGLKGKAHDANGEISWLDLASYVAKNVPSRLPELMDRNDLEQQPNLLGNLTLVPILVRSSDDLDDPDYVRGQKLLTGVGAPANENLAFESFLAAASRGHTLAIAFVAHSLSVGWGAKQPDLDEAAKWFGRAMPALQGLADRGNATAQTLLGNMLRDGVGVEKNEVEGARLLRKAAEQADMLGQLALADCYAHGLGVAKDESEAVRWCRKAAEQGLAEALFVLGDFYGHGVGVVQDDREAVRWYRKAADRNWPDAWHELAHCYQTGRGLPKDEKEAVRCLQSAAGLGNDDAKVCLGWCYFDGKGIKKDINNAIKFFREAADANNPEGQNALGVIYCEGRGVGRDYEVAFKFFQRAAEQELPKAQTWLGRMYFEGLGVRQNVIEANKWFQIAAENGDANGCVWLGRSYAEGRGVTKNLKQAAVWLRKASQGEDPLAAQDADDLIKKYRLK